MVTPNKATEITKRIKAMQEKKQNELDLVSAKQKKAEDDLRTIRQTIKKAAGALDIDAYEAAKKDLNKTMLTVEMCKDKSVELQKQEYISEAESDAVIDELLGYEEKLEKEFLEAIAEPLQELRDLLKDYKAAVREAENVIVKWCSEIRANYRSTNSIYTRKAQKSDRAVPVRFVPFEGCGEAIRLEHYFDKEKKMSKE